MSQLKKIAGGGKAIAIMLMAMLLASGMFLTANETKKENKDEVKKGYLGVYLEKLSLRDKKDFGVNHGVLVTGVEDESPADKAGIKEDDIIQTFGGVEIHSPEDLTKAVRQTKPGVSAKMKLIRVDTPIELTVTVGETSEKDQFNRMFFSDGKKIEIPELKDLKGFKELKELKELKGFNFHSSAYLGVRLQELNPDLAPYFGAKKDEGVLVLEVEKNSPADKAGLKSGDVILEVASKKTSNGDSVREIVSEKKKGDVVEVKVLRQKSPQTFKVTLDEGAGFGTMKFFWKGDGKEHDVFMHKFSPENFGFTSKDGSHFEVKAPHIFIRRGGSCCIEPGAKGTCSGHVDKEVVIIRKKAGDKDEKEVQVKTLKDEKEKDEHTL